MSPDNSKDRTLLIVDEDRVFVQKLGSAMSDHGFEVSTVGSVTEGVARVSRTPPAFAVVDVRLSDGDGLDVLRRLKQQRADARAIVVTGYGNIASAVKAVKLGAVDYLPKPANAEDVISALTCVDGERVKPPANPMSADRVRWEHIQRIFELCDHNVSETARRLGMHRRTLQRILSKRAPH